MSTASRRRHLARVGRPRADESRITREILRLDREILVTEQALARAIVDAIGGILACPHISDAAKLAGVAGFLGEHRGALSEAAATAARREFADHVAHGVADDA